MADSTFIALIVVIVLILLWLLFLILDAYLGLFVFSPYQVPKLAKAFQPVTKEIPKED